MKIVLFALVLFLILIIVLLICSYGLFLYGFKIGDRGRRTPEEILDGNGMYGNLHSELLRVAKEMEKEPFKEHEIISRDGLKLKGYSLVVNDDAPMVLFCHGYTGTWKLDGYGTYRLCKDKGYNLFVFDQRAHGKSEGKYATFGVKEQYDCLDWISFVKDNFGKNRPLLLSGVSMGCATAVMTASIATNKLVDGLIADCGYSCGTDIFAKAAVDLKLPVKLAVFLAVLSSKIYGRFDASKSDVSLAASKLDMPVLFIHGTKDSVVPFEMLEKNYTACKSEHKYKLVVEGCDHASAAPFNYNSWKDAVEEMLKDVKGFNA